jgi:ribonuclease PH
VTRRDGRAPAELRPLVLEPGFMPYAEGSCLIGAGNTRVVCTATIEDSVPRWMAGRGSGWVTAEYSMLPRSSPQRIPREVGRGRPSGRTQEIQRLIGRALRAVVDMEALGERSVLIDCDVLQADGGTRTASISGAYVALAQALSRLRSTGKLSRDPFVDSVAAVSVGIVGSVACLDLDYSEDSTAEVDMNVVMTGGGRLVEVQGTAEHGSFDRAQLDELVDLATLGIGRIAARQKEALAEPVE